MTRIIEAMFVTMALFGLWVGNATAGSDPVEIETVRQAVIEKYSTVEAMYYEAHAIDEDRIDVYASTSRGVGSRRTYLLQSLIQSYLYDPEDALKDWMEIPVDFVFFGGETTTIGSWGLDAYVVHEFGKYPNPWGANPVHTCVWPMLSGWAENGTLTQADDGGWTLKLADRFLWIAFDDELRVQWVKHKYAEDSPGFTQWIYSGYPPATEPEQLPSAMSWVVQHFDQDGEPIVDIEQDYRLVFAPERGPVEVRFFSEDGSVRLKTRTEVQFRRIARESGQSFKKVILDHAGACGAPTRMTRCSTT
jgi:hypothetical protein